MGFEMSYQQHQQFHEALACPICPKLFVESLWSLIAHINAAHRDSPLVLDYHSLEKLKKVVPKSSVCIIRPAFTVDGNQSDLFADNSVITDCETSSASPLQRTPSFPKAILPESQSVSPEPSDSGTKSPSLKSPSIPLETAASTAIPSSSSSTPASTSTPSIPTTTTSTNKRPKRHSPYPPRSTKKQLCQKCGELFDNRCLLTLHMMIHKRKTHPYQCPINGCFQCYDSKMKFRSHLSRVHQELTSAKIEALLRMAPEAGENGMPPNFDECSNSISSSNNKTMTEKLVETVEKIIIKKEIFDS